MAIDFSEKIQVTNPTAFYIGRYVVSVGVIGLIVGIITFYTGDLLIPAQMWCAMAVPALAIGGILIAVSLTRV